MKTQPNAPTEEEAKQIREQILNRLRASKERADTEADKEGDAAGRDWAEKQAESAELRRLAVFVHASDGRHLGEEADFEFFRIINPREIPTAQGIAEFWRTVADGEETPDPIFVEAFVSGAVAFWDEVENQL